MFSYQARLYSRSSFARREIPLHSYIASSVLSASACLEDEPGRIRETNPMEAAQRERSRRAEYASHSCQAEHELIERFNPREIRPVIFTLLRQQDRPFFPPTTIVSFVLSAETP